MFSFLNYLVVVYATVVVTQLVNQGVTKETVIENLKWPYNVVLKVLSLVKTS